VIVGVENPGLRRALVQALEGINVRPELISPEDLPRSGLSGYVLIFLETGNDVTRLSKTARHLYKTWEEPGLATTRFLAYATTDVMTYFPLGSETGLECRHDRTR
jgi:hypothetical protein